MLDFFKSSKNKQLDAAVQKIGMNRILRIRTRNPHGCREVLA